MYFQKARDVGAAHGSFLVESKACVGLGNVAAMEGRHEEGLELLRNSVVAARLSEGDTDANEVVALTSLIQVLLGTSAIEEVEPLVIHFRKLCNARSALRVTGVFLFGKFRGLVFNARLHEVLCTRTPMLGTPSSCSALAFRPQKEHFS